MTKTKMIKDLKTKECQYICMNQEPNDPCSKCPLHMYINEKQKIKGCYYVIKQLVDEKGKQTITL